MSYHEKKEEMYKKYEHAVKAIAIANGVDIGVARAMLEANVLQGGSYKYVNEDEFKKDWEELTSAE